MLLIKMFQEQVKKNPDKIAVKTLDKGITYRELETRGNQIALKIKEVSGGTSQIALLFDHGINMIEGTIAALMANKIYVPFDPTYPKQRLMYMLENSGTSLIVTNGRNLGLAKELAKESNSNSPIEILNIDDIVGEDVSQNIEATIERTIDEDSIAYILYTSGSTGKPKGVVQTHKNVLHFVESYIKDMKITPQDRLTLFSAFSHDAAVMDIYGGLLSGATLYPLNIREQINIGEVSNWLVENEITLWHSVPTLYRYFTNTLKEGVELPKLRMIVLGGERVREHDVETFKRLFPQAVLVNLYGQSESSYNSAQFFTKDTDFEGITLGEATEETELLVISDKGKKLGLLRVGEIVVKSNYIAKGYWGEKEKTEAVFRQSKEGSPLYFTGDLGRRLEDGTIEYMGRKDAQVKIRGFRIEPEEVEGKLLANPLIEEAIVIARDIEEGEGYLCAYMVAQEEISATILREDLSKELPDYMIPLYFMQLDKMPLTPTGKIDRNALPEPNKALDRSQGYMAPRNETEGKVAELWQKILGIEKVGVRDHFFQLGGHSLKATALVAELHRVFNVEVPLKVIFTSPTIEEISQYILGAKESNYRGIEAVEKRDAYPVSAAQRRLFILNQFNEASTNYNMSFAMEIQGQLEIDQLEKAFNSLIERHEALRTSFETKEGEICQRVHEEWQFKVDYVEGVKFTEEEKQRVLEEFVQPFDLKKAPLLRVKLLKEAEDRHLLMLDLHHIISDGVSMGVLVQEFAGLYEGKDLPSQKLQYKDFAVWQRTEAVSEKMKVQEEYWVHQLKGEIKPLKMPLDFKRPAKLTFEGSTIGFEIPTDIVEKLEELSREKKVTMNMILVALYNGLLYQYTGQEEFMVGSLVAGRNHLDLQNVIGMFSNFIPLRSKINVNESFASFLEGMKKVMEDAYSHQEYPFDQMVEKIHKAVGNSRNPIFDTMLVFHNEIDPTMNWSIEGLNFKGRELRNQGTSLDFKLDIYQGNEGQLNGYLQYNKNLFFEKTMEGFIRNFNDLTRKVLENPEVLMVELGAISNEDKTLTISATFTADPIKEYIQYWGKRLGLNINVEFTGYNQVFQELLTPEGLLSANDGEKLLLIRFEDWIRNGVGNELDQCKKLERNFNELLDILKRQKHSTSYYVGLFPISTHLNLGDTVKNYLEILNMRWKETVEGLENLTIIDFTTVGEVYSIGEIFDPIKDEAGHLPFSDVFYAAMGTKICRGIYEGESCEGIDSTWGQGKSIFASLTEEDLLKLSLYDEEDGGVTRANYVAPETETEKRLVDIITELLPVDNIGVEDDFFSLGGDSLKATLLMSKIFKVFQVEISLKEIFELPQIRAMAVRIEELERSTYRAIPSIEEREAYPLSSAQSRIFMLQQFEKDSSSYNMPGAVMIEGKLDMKKVEATFRQLIKRHEALRTSFELREGEAVQILHDDVDFTLQYVGGIDGYEGNRLIKPFNLEKAPLMRATLVKYEEEKHLLVYDLHHIIADGVSMGILVKEFVELYEGRELKILPIQYKDYAVWQREGLGKEAILKQEGYWLEKFAGEIPVLNLPTDYPRPSLQSFEGDRIDFKIDPQWTKKIKEAVAETGTTLYMYLLAASNILFSKYSGGEDIVIGSPIAGRNHDEVQGIMGMFVNTLGMRNLPTGNKTFREFLKEVKGNAMEAFENQEYPFEELVNKLELERDLSRNPLFDVMFSMQNMNLSSRDVEGLKFTPQLLKNSIAKFDMTITAEEIGDSIAINIEYCTKLFKKETIEGMGRHFTNILRETVDSLDIKLREIQMMSAEEKHKLLHHFNDTKVVYDNGKKLHQLFEEQVEKNPDAIALVFEEIGYTYGAINKKANQLARGLRNRGVTANVIVGIMAEASIETVTGILAILKAGGAYLPIDPEYPVERISYLLKDSGAKTLLYNGEAENICGSLRELPNFEGELINLSDTNLYDGDYINLEDINAPEDLAYVIYTSGSTGMPKGVMIQHSNIVHQMKGLISTCRFDESLHHLLLYKLTFDVSVQQLFVSLISGGKLFVPSEDVKNNIHQLWDFIHRKQINIIDTVPSFAEALIDSRDTDRKDSFKYFVLGADTFSKNLYDRLKSAFTIGEIINAYGPTEATINATLYFCKDEDLDKSVPIGKPLPNYHIYILDQYNKPVPMGVSGELCIGGVGVARGYLNRPELTAERFIANPFVEGERLYKTGDLAKWLPNGNVEFLGRIDHQVKIRGFRIELGEIEGQMLKLPAIKEAVVVDHTDEKGNKYLCGYFVGETVGSEEIDVITTIKNELGKVLPDYMIPTYFIRLEEMPLTSNGKINRKALPKPEEGLGNVMEYVPLENELEEKLSEIFREVLNREKIGRQDHFFEMGGHSLKAILLVAKIHKELKVEVPLKEIFKNPTVGGLATYIENKQEEAYTAIEVVEEREYYPVSSAEKRLFTLNQFERDSIGYNMPGAIRIKGQLDKQRLEETFQVLIQRHSTLRTSFVVIEEEVLQKIHESVDFRVEYMEVEEEEVSTVTRDFIRPFDLAFAPLLRVRLISTEEEDHLLLFDMHHIISDGVSMEILVKEFVMVYGGKELPSLRIQYKDYAVWQKGLMENKVMELHEKYWREKLSGELPVLNLPTDYTRPSIQRFEGDRVSFHLSKEHMEKLKELATESQSTIYMVLLAAFNVLLAKYSGQEDIIIGTPIAGRNHADLQNVIGMFVNTLAMRNYPEGNLTFAEFLQEVKKNAIEAYEHEEYQFEELVEKLEIRRDISRNPIFDTVFVMQNSEEEELKLENITFLPYELEKTIAKFDLTLSAMEGQDGLYMDFEYSTNLFKRVTIERMKKYFINLLEGIVDNKDQKIADINMLLQEEEKAILSLLDNRAVAYPKEKTIQQLFEEQAVRVPERIAVVCEGERITYRELNEKANQLAYTLRKKGVQADTIVGILLDRSIEVIVGMLGILKAGGAYLPIDPTYPKERIHYMMEDSQIKLLVTVHPLLDEIDLGGFEGEKIYLDEEVVYYDATENLTENPTSINTPNDLAYIIYTSGSTGNPKGAMIEHKNVVRLMKNDKELFDFSEEDTWTMFHSMCFDFSVWEIYGALLFGGKLVIVKKEVAQNPKEYLKLLKGEKVTVLNQTPTAFYNLCREEEQFQEQELMLRYVIFGGEALKPKMLKTFREKYPKTQLINMYGITETTVHVTYKEIQEEEIEKNISNIGGPIPTLSMYIMDKNLKLQPIGVPGEICVGGDGVGRGYLNRPELTGDKFVENPYGKGERLYRSGDLARVLSNGELEYLGRIDQQVKIRGFRIELGEIETQLLKHSSIKEAVVLHKVEDNGEGYLCGYIVVEKESHKEESSIGELRRHLAERLPDYMIPAYFVQLEEIPLTSNGKVDRKRLPEPKEGLGSGGGYVAPKNKIEEILVGLWQEVLGIAKVGTQDNFFELGGHSLKATSLVAKIHQSLNVEVPLKEIFTTPTVAGIASYIKNAKESQYSAIEKTEKQPWYPVSSAQKRMFVLHQSNPDSTGYNMSFGMKIEGNLDKNCLEETFTKLIERHEALRTSFEMKEGEVVQVIHDDVDFAVEYVDTSSFTEEEIQEIVDSFVEPFEISKAPLLRVKLLKEREGTHNLMVDLHHIISDGVSMGILMQEFVELYEGKELPELKLQYKDFAVWQNSAVASQRIAEEEEYWRGIFNNELEPLNMPLDFERPATLTFEGSNLPFEISSEVVERLKTLAKEKNTTLNMLLLSIYSLLLSKYTNQEDIVIGSLVAGRGHKDLEGIMGMFANFLPIKGNVREEERLEEFLEKMKEKIMEAYDHQEYPFEKIVEMVEGTRDRSRNPIFDTMMIFHNEIDNQTNWEIEGLHFNSYSLKNETVPLDFKIDFYMGAEGQLMGYLQYNKNLFKEETMKAFSHHYQSLIEGTLGNLKNTIGSIKVFDKEEKAQLDDRKQQMIKNPKATSDAITLAVSATFTAEPIKEYIQWWGREFGQNIQVEFASYNQVFQELLTPDSLINTNQGANLLLVRMEDWIRADEGSDVEKCKKLERTFTEFVEVLKNKNRDIPYFVGVFPLSTHLNLSIAITNYLEVLNMRWREALKDQENIHLIDFTDLGNSFSISEVFDPMKDKAGHLPFSDGYYAAMGTTIARKIYSWKKQPFKVIVLDCDNTLWKGVAGEDGPLGVRVEEPFKILQNMLLQKYNEGMLLAICSKNNEADAWEVFEKNPDMILKKEHFVEWRINWQAKSQNIKEMAQALNLGVDSFIFIDDSPMECTEVMSNCPQVLTLQLPEDSKQIPHYFRHVWALDRFKVTQEDRKRTQMYMQERKRQAVSEAGLSLTDFLESLQLKMSMRLLEKEQYPRVAQLTQRTNQFNLSTIRRTEAELESLLADDAVTCWTVEVADRFGEYGLVGVVITKEVEKSLFVDTFLLSCRVLARGVEEAILSGLKKYSLEKGLELLEARYYPTPKNKPILSFMEKAWRRVGEGAEGTGEENTYTLFRLPVEEIPDAIDYIDCYYREAYSKEQEKVVQEKTEDLLELEKITSNYVAVAVEEKTCHEVYNWRVEIVNGENLLYKYHLLPLQYNTGEALLGLPVHEVEEESVSRSIYVAPIGRTEETLVRIWQEILGLEKIGTADDFFKIGGDSLKAIILVSKIHKEFNLELPLKDVFEKPTIKDIAACITKMQTSDEARGNNIEQALILLNEKKEENIFFFPPIIGYGISYKYLSNLVQYASVYGLNFIEGEEKLDHYVKLITSVQGEGPYRLLGYSAGGTLAYKVAMELEKRGYEVSDIILFDSYKKDKKGTLNKEDIQMSVENMINALKADGAFANNMDSEIVLENIADKVEGYEAYINDTVIDGEIKANIHFIKAGEDYIIPGVIDTRDGWKANTTGEFLMYEGFGNHFEMINPGYAEENEEILRKICGGFK